MKEFEKVRIAAYEKISKEVISDINMTLGIEADDYFKDLYTANICGYIYSRMAEERTLNYYCERPTFLDWLFKRRKKAVFNLKVKDLLLNAKPPNTERIYLIDE